MDDGTYGVITEIGDLGLGFENLNEQDEQTYKENLEKETKSNK